LLLGKLLHPPPEERLAAAVVAPRGLESRPALGHVRQFVGDDAFEAIQADSEEVQSPLWHRAFPQGSDDFSASFGADFHGSLIQIKLAFQLGDI